MGMLLDFPSPPDGDRRRHMQLIERNKALVSRFVAAINRQDWSELAELVAPDFVRHSAAGGEIRGAAALIEYLQQAFVVFPDATESLEDLVAEGDKVAARHLFRGTQQGPRGEYPPSGRVMQASCLAIYRIDDGRIAEVFAEWDRLAGLRQLGQLR